MIPFIYSLRRRFIGRTIKPWIQWRKNKSISSYSSGSINTVNRWNRLQLYIKNFTYDEDDKTIRFIFSYNSATNEKERHDINYTASQLNEGIVTTFEQHSTDAGNYNYMRVQTVSGGTLYIDINYRIF